MGQPKLFTFKSTDGHVFRLTEREKSFCEYYSNYGCGGAEAIFEAGYKPKNKKTAYSMASENLRKPKILAYINHLYKSHDFSDEEVLREHWFLIKQHADLTNKAKAIDMYYKKRGLYKNEPQDAVQTVVVRSYKDYSDEELETAVQKIAKARL